jgi:DNA-binding IclR family transcriptional regulator
MAIVSLLTEQADRGATVSEIGAALGQTPGTLVPVLASLAAGGFVVRQPSDRRYRLGPALIAPGQVAAGRFPALEPTRRAMEELAGQTGYPVFAFQRDGEHARLVETVWDLSHPAPWMRIGDALPIEPPLGSVFVAWAARDEIDHWLARGHPSKSTRAALEHRLTTARALGFVVELRPPLPLQPELSRLVRRGQQMRRAERIPRSITGVEGFLAERLDHRTTYEVSTVSVPVRTASGAVDLALNLVGFDEPVSGRELRRLGGVARAVAAGLVDRLAGDTA